MYNSQFENERITEQMDAGNRFFSGSAKSFLNVFEVTVGCRLLERTQIAHKSIRFVIIIIIIKNNYNDRLFA